MSHLLSSEMQLQRENEKNDFVQYQPYVPSSSFPILSSFPTYYFPLPNTGFFLCHIWELKLISASEVMIF